LALLRHPQWRQLQLTTRGKLLKYKVLETNIRSHNAELASSSPTLATNKFNDLGYEFGNVPAAIAPPKSKAILKGSDLAYVSCLGV
jgi:hypothetical protein